MATKTKKHRAAPEQGELPTMEREIIKPIEAAAHAYVNASNIRMRHTEEEVEKHTILLHQMKEHGLTVYKMKNGEIVELMSSEKVKVRQPSLNGEEG